MKPVATENAPKNANVLPVPAATGVTTSHLALSAILNLRPSTVVLGVQDVAAMLVKIADLDINIV